MSRYWSRNSSRSWKSYPYRRGLYFLHLNMTILCVCYNIANLAFKMGPLRSEKNCHLLRRLWISNFVIKTSVSSYWSVNTYFVFILVKRSLCSRQVTSASHACFNKIGKQDWREKILSVIVAFEWKACNYFSYLFFKKIIKRYW